MTRLLTAVVFWCVLSLSALAQCRGTDLSSTLTEAEQSALDARLATTPYPSGNHWIARRGDEVVHLVGTMHLGDPRLDAPAERLGDVIDGAATLLLEMTQTEQAELENAIATDPEMLLLADATLPDLLPEEDWTRLADAMRARGMPPFMGARMQPWYVSMLLALPSCLAAQLSEQDGLDSRLEARARDAGVPVKALEPFDTGFKLFAATDLETQILLIRASLTPPETNEDLFETLLAAYFAQDHARSQITLEVLGPRLTPLTEDENARVFRLMDEVLIVTRNKTWIPVILDTLAGTEGPVVAAFGAGHLSGPEGILNLLAAEGFTLERAAF